MSAVILPPKLSLRRIVCARCGTPFDCDAGSDSGACWCANETFRLPVPTAASEDCLCPACLRAAATSAGHSA